MDEERSVLTETADDFDDIELTDADLGDETEDTADEKPEADQLKAESQQEKEPTDESADKPKEAETNQSFKLKYLGEEREVSREEVIQLAQKGTDYDRIRTKYDEAKPLLEKHGQYEKFLKELADTQGVDIPTYMNAVRAKVLAQKEGIDETTALERIKLDTRKEELDKRESELNEQKKADEQKQNEQSKRDKDIKDFLSEYNGIDIKKIPDEVWLDVSKGSTLVDAYRRYENKQLKNELEMLKQEQKNKDRSTGSKSTVGVEKDDKWFDGWDDE